MQMNDMILVSVDDHVCRARRHVGPAPRREVEGSRAAAGPQAGRQRRPREAHADQDEQQRCYRRKAVDLVNADSELGALVITGAGDVFAPGGEMGGRHDEGFHGRVHLVGNQSAVLDPMGGELRYRRCSTRTSKRA